MMLILDVAGNKFQGKGASRSVAVETVHCFWWLLAISTPGRRMSVHPVGDDGNTTLKVWL